MPSLQQLSTAQLRQALQLSEEIDKMQRKLESILGGSSAELLSTSARPAKRGGGGRGGRRTMSAEGREKIAAAARARWAKVHAASGKSVAGAAAKSAKARKVQDNGKAAPKKAAAGKGRNLSPEGRAKLAAAMKARWEARKKGATA